MVPSGADRHRLRLGNGPGDPPELVADPALARTRLDWQPRHSDLDTIIGTALAWERRAGHAQP